MTLVALPKLTYAQAEAETAPAEETPIPSPEQAGPAEQAPAAQKPAEQQPAAPAAAAEPGAGKGVEEIVVTGTRIGRSNLAEYGHITVLDSQQIARSGVTTIDQLLIEMPSVTLQGINRNSNNGGTGLAWVDLRNLGAGRTLVLVNGRRMVTNGTGVSEAVDLNNIPVPMIERVEVLLDGASAIYGSDAVAGVVNVILKDNFEGLELDAFGGISTYGDGGEVNLSGTTGANYDRGNVTANVTYSNRGKVRQADRDWAKNPVLDAFYEDGELVELYGSSYVAEGRVGGLFFRPTADGASFQRRNFYNPDHGYNYGLDQYLSGSVERYALTLNGHYRLTDTARLYVEGLYTNRQSEQALAPMPIGGANSTYIDHGFIVPVTNQYIPKDFLATLAPGQSSIRVNRRFVEAGDRIYQQNSDTFRIVTGLKGKLLESYAWDVFFNLGRNRSQQRINNMINLTRAWESADPDRCRANANRGCVEGDFFGLNAIQPEVLDYIRYTDVERTGYSHLSTGASFTGALFDLPGGPLAFALGGEYRDESGFNFPSPIVAGGDSASNGLDPTEGGYKVGEAFGELSIPLMSGLVGLHDVTLDVAGRYSSYNTFGDDFTYRAGLSYAPVPDFRLRGIYATAFRAPGISDLYGGAADSYETLSDPCSNWDTNSTINSTVRDNCRVGDGGRLLAVPAGYNQAAVTGTQIRTNIGGNPDLDAENAEVINVGAVFTPTFLEGLSLTADFYNIEVTNAIVNPEPQTILNKCYESQGLSDPFCRYIGRSTDGAVNDLQAYAQNIGKVNTAGLDFTANYRLDLGMVGLPGIGRVDLGWQGNYLIQYDETQEGVVDEYAGTITAGSGTYTHWRWNQLLGFAREDWSVSSMVRYIGGAKVFDYYRSANIDPADYPYTEVEDAWYWDLSAQATFEGLTIIAGVDNVLDRDPPFFIDGGTNSSGDTYDYLGRFFYARLNYKF